ncbi:hypothetical protein [Azospirillum endophyticum]
MQMVFPLVAISQSEIKHVFYAPVAFVDDAGGTHAATAWQIYTETCWARYCPTWTFLPLVDTYPADNTQLWTAQPQSAWMIGPDAVRVTYAGVPKSDEQLEAELTATIARDVQAWMDAAVRPRGYDSILSACSYATSTNPLYAAEGQACVAHRDDVWAICFALLGEVKARKRPIMTSAEVIAELPPLVWPD